jgi:hypothetical protein
MRVWLQAIYLFCSSKKGISTRELQRTFNCCRPKVAATSAKIVAIKDLSMWAAALDARAVLYSIRHA